jgi:hypothetical protein
VGLVSDGRNHFTHSHDNSQLFKFGEDNPYVTAFFRWWESDLHQTLDELRITGGEPLMSGYTWQLLDWFKKNKGRSKTRLAINSNLGTQVDLDRLFDSVDSPIDLYTSNESVGVHAEYIRDGLVWDDWVNNIEIMCDNFSSTKLRGLHIMCTINALCLESLTEFLDFIVDCKQCYGRDFPTFTLNILRFPSFQSPLVLPDEIRTKHKDTLESWLAANNNEWLHQHEVNHIKRLIDYLDVVKTPHIGAAEQNILQQDFKKFYEQYDSRRKKNFQSAFPNLKNWYDTI